MDERLRHTKRQELKTWRINLARAEGKAAQQGATTRLETDNEIDTAKENIKRIEQELDAGAETSREETQIGIMQLLLGVVQRTEHNEDAIEQNRAALQEIRTRIFVSPRQRALALLAVLMAASSYTLVVIKESRDFLLDNLFLGALIIFLMLTVAILLWSLSVLVQFGENNSHD